MEVTRWPWGSISCGGRFRPDLSSQHRDCMDSCILYLCWVAPWCHPGHPFALCGCIWCLGGILWRADGGHRVVFLLCLFPWSLTSVWGCWTPHIPMAGCAATTGNSWLRCAFPSSFTLGTVGPFFVGLCCCLFFFNSWGFFLLCTHHVHVCEGFILKNKFIHWWCNSDCTFLLVNKLSAQLTLYASQN